MVIKHIVRATALSHHRLSTRIVDNYTVFDAEKPDEVDNINFLSEEKDTKESRILECLNHDFKGVQPLWAADILIKGDYSQWEKDTSTVEVTVIWTMHHSLGDGLSMVLSYYNGRISGRWRGHISTCVQFPTLERR